MEAHPVPGMVPRPRVISLHPPSKPHEVASVHPILQTGKLRLREVKWRPKDTQLVDGGAQPHQAHGLVLLYRPAPLRFRRIGGTGQGILGSGHSGLPCQFLGRVEGSRL